MCADLLPDGKSAFDALMKLNEFRFQRWQDRRKYEWRISLGVWALLTASIAFKKEISPPPLMWIVAWILIVTVLHAL